jgi:putative aminopeptidase FrvX
MVSELPAFLKELVSLPGLYAPGKPLGDRIRREWAPMVDEIGTSRLGNLHATKYGSGPEPRPRVLIATHMDTIAMMVGDVVDGFLRLRGAGGLDPRVLPGLPVIVHGRRPLEGTIIQPPAVCLGHVPRAAGRALDHLLVDLGLPPRQVTRNVRPGDVVTIDLAPFQLGDDCIASPSLGSRGPLAALTTCLLELKRRDHSWDVIAVATAQEERTAGGALTSAYMLLPDVAVAVGVTNGQGPGVREHQGYALGQGPTNGLGPSVHPGIHREMQITAQREGIELGDEVLPGLTGADVEGLQVAREGIPTGVLNIPLRYPDTGVEVVALSDIRRTGFLLACFVSGLGSDFAETLSWD